MVCVRERGNQKQIYKLSKPFLTLTAFDSISLFPWVSVAIRLLQDTKATQCEHPLNKEETVYHED